MGNRFSVGCRCCGVCCKNLSLSVILSGQIDGPFYNPMYLTHLSGGPPPTGPQPKIALDSFLDLFNTDNILSDLPITSNPQTFVVYQDPDYGYVARWRTYYLSVDSPYKYKYYQNGLTTYPFIDLPDYYYISSNSSYIGGVYNFAHTRYMGFKYIICKNPRLTYSQSFPTLSTFTVWEAPDPDICYIVPMLGIHSYLFGYRPFAPSFPIHQIYTNFILYNPIPVIPNNNICCNDVLLDTSNILYEDKYSFSDELGLGSTLGAFGHIGPDLPLTTTLENTCV